MTETREEMDALDRELAKMAEETPEMPDDFHARWTAQIRAEAARGKTAKRQERRRQWRYVLSAAAVFVILIGGTLLTREQGAKQKTDNVSLRKPEQAMTQNTVENEIENVPEEPERDDFTADTMMAEEPAEAAGAAGAANGAGEVFAFSMAYDAAETVGDEMDAAYDAVYEEAAEEYEEAGTATAYEGEPAAPYGQDAFGAFEERKATDSRKDASAKQNGTLQAEAESRTAAGFVMYTSMPTAAVTAEATAARKAEKEKKEPEAPEKAEEFPATGNAEEETEKAEPETEISTAKDTEGEPAAESGFISFLKDLGIFTLQTLAGAAAGAGVVLLVTLIGKGRKKQKKQ